MELKVSSCLNANILDHNTNRALAIVKRVQMLKNVLDYMKKKCFFCCSVPSYKSEDADQYNISHQLLCSRLGGLQCDEIESSLKMFTLGVASRKNRVMVIRKQRKTNSGHISTMGSGL